MVDRAENFINCATLRLFERFNYEVRKTSLALRCRNILRKKIIEREIIIMELRLKKVTIKGLCNRHTINVDLSNKCAALIGANGIGKTATLKIINCIMTGNYVDIIAVPFEELIISYEQEGNNRRISLKYEDFLPGTQYIEEQFVSGMAWGWEYKEDLHELLDEIKDKNLYSQFIYCVLRKKEFTSALKNIVNNYNSLRYGEIDWYSIELVKRYEVGRPIYDVPFGPALGHLAEYDTPSRIDNCLFLEDAPVLRKKYREIATCFRKDVFYFNLVDNYTIDSNYVLESIFEDEERKWAYQNDNLDRYPMLKKEIDLRENDEDFFCMNLGVGENPFAFSGSNDKQNEIQNALTDERKLYINRLINTSFFNPSVISDINAIAIDYTKKYYDAIESFNSTDIDYYISLLAEVDEKLCVEFIEKYTLYIRPVLVRDSLFDMDISSMTRYNLPEEKLRSEEDPFGKKEDPFGNLWVGICLGKDIIFRKCFFDFIDEAYAIAADYSNRTESVKHYESILKKYIMDKSVKVTPAGIIVKNSDDTGPFSIYDPDVLDLSVLSSGEKKIIIIFAVGVFFNKVIMLDEPELSLSLVWQEDMLVDLINECKGDLIVATHSPYIVQDESVRSFIQYLP